MDDVILPVPKEAVTDGGDERPPVSYIFEPAPEEILEGLLPAYVEIAVYRALLESSASEQGARMSAMERQRQRRGDDRRPSRWRSTAPARRRSRRRSSRSSAAPRRWDEPRGLSHLPDT